MWVYFGALSYVLLIYFSILSLISCCHGYYSSNVSLKVSISPLTLFSFNIMLTILGLLSFCINFKSSLLMSKKLLAGFLLRLHWIYKSGLEEIIFWQYWVFLAMNIQYFSIYLVLWFISVLYSFPHIDVHIVRFTPKYFILGGAKVNGIVFLISNSICSLLVYRLVY